MNHDVEITKHIKLRHSASSQLFWSTVNNFSVDSVICSEVWRFALAQKAVVWQARINPL